MIAYNSGVRSDEKWGRLAFKGYEVFLTYEGISLFAVGTLREGLDQLSET